MQIIKRSTTALKSKFPPLLQIPEEYDHKPVKGHVAVFDTETDPFAPGLVVKPFTCGFYIPEVDYYIDFWGDDCVRQFFEWLAHVTAPDGMFPEWKFSVFVHNGGNFDFYFCTEFFDTGMTPFIINGRLVRIECQGHEFRDSYAMIPVALGNALKAEDGGKIEIDYDKFTRENRDANRVEILHYQQQDCKALAVLVVEWLKEFGNKLTMASVALPMLRSFHGFDNMSESTDNEMRPYYSGGRCQAFENGVIIGDFVGYDITSSYPNVMRNETHPISAIPFYTKTITDRSHFADITAWSDGALPVRLPNGGLDFPRGTRRFYACMHEVRAAQELGILRINKVHSACYFEQEGKFTEFVDTFFAKRQAASEAGDEIRKLFFKLVLNSSYGKFAQDPRKYERWVYDPAEIPTPLYCDPCHENLRVDGFELCANCKEGVTHPFGWYLHTIQGGKFIYAAPQEIKSGRGFFNVATAASITSAARASLMRGIYQARRPIYCDTDSIFCESLSEGRGVVIDAKALGAWKEEFTADTLCIGGKKLYACFKNGELIKKASKGVKLEGEEIRLICEGGEVEYANPVPKFKLDGSASFVTRNIKRTWKDIEITDHETHTPFQLI